MDTPDGTWFVPRRINAAYVAALLQHTQQPIVQQLLRDKLSRGITEQMMKRIAAIVAAIMVLTLAVPGLAAIDLNGKLETKFQLTRENDDWKLGAKTGLEVETGFNAGGGDGVRAVVKLNALNAGADSFDEDGNPTKDLRTYNYPNETMKLEITEAYLESEGAFWHGGPEVYTRIGDMELNWNDYVAHMGKHRGILVDGINLGPAKARAFLGWDREGNNPRNIGFQAEASVEGVDVEATVIRTRGAQEAALSVGTDIMPGLRADGVVAIDADMNPIYRVNARYEVAPGTTLIAGYRGNKNFNPTYTNPVDEDDNVVYDEHTGFNVGIETEQSGVKLSADYDNPTATANVKAETQVEQIDVWAEAKIQDRAMQNVKFGAKRDIPVIDGLNIAGEYEGKYVPNEKIEHTLKASTSTDLIPQLQGLAVNGEVKLLGTELKAWKVGASYSAPNGINLGAEYHSENGPLMTAGMKASF